MFIMPMLLTSIRAGHSVGWNRVGWSEVWSQVWLGQVGDAGKIDVRIVVWSFHNTDGIISCLTSWTKHLKTGRNV